MVQNLVRRLPRRQSDKIPSRNASNKRRKSDLKDDQDEDVCFDCGKPGHRRGDKEYPNPSFLTKRIQAKRVRFVDEKDQTQCGSFFSKRLHLGPRQSNLVASRGAKSDIRFGIPDPNPIVNPGCPRSVGGVHSAAALCLALGSQFKLRELDCMPFFHGYGPECSNSKLVIAIWDLPVQDVEGVTVTIPFYITQGDGPLILGNEILHKSRLLGPENLLVVPPHVRGLSSKEVPFQTYNEPMSASDPDSVRTYLFVVPAKTVSVKSFFSSYKAYFGRRKEDEAFTKKFSESKAAKRLAIKLHGYTHLPLEDMVTICERSRVLLNPVLRQALKRVVQKYTSCQSTGRPLNSRRVSFGKILAGFNHHVQVDYFFVGELDNDPILHMVDYRTGFSATASGASRSMNATSREFEIKWVNIHGPPAVVSADLEFFNAKFINTLRYFGIEIQTKPAS